MFKQEDLKQFIVDFELKGRHTVSARTKQEAISIVNGTINSILPDLEDALDTTIQDENYTTFVAELK